MNKWANNYYVQEGQHAGGERQVMGRKSPHHTAQHRRRRSSQMMRVVGTEMAHLWVFRVVHLSKVTLRSFIERQGIQVLDIQQVSQKEAAYKSFLVTVNENDASTLLYRTFWPGLVTCRMWYERGDARRASIFSRRHARDAHAATHIKDGEAGGGGREDGGTQRLEPRRRRPLPRDTHTTVTHLHSSLQNNENIKERKNRENVDGNMKDLRKDEKNAIIKKGNIRENNKRVGGTKPGSRRNSTSERDKSVKNKGNKLNDGKKKVIKNTVKRKDKRMGDKGRGNRRNTDLGNGNTDAADHENEPLIIRNKEKIAGKIVLEKSSNDSKKQIVDKGRSQDMSDGNKKGATEVKTPRPVDEGQIDKGKEGRHMAQRHQSPTSQHLKSQPGIQVLDPHVLPQTHENSNYATISKLSVNSSEKEVKNPSWMLSLSKLLILSSEDVVTKLLSSEYDDLLSQDYISDDELFLGVKVLAHSVRARSDPNDLRRLIYKILQPHVISLIKTFSVTVEMQYPDRAERYFWDLAKFLDLYIVNDMVIDGMPSLLSTCLSEILALSYRSYVSDDLVKVYRGMQEWVFRSARDREQAKHDGR